MALIQVNLGRPAPETYNTQKKTKRKKENMHKLLNAQICMTAFYANKLSCAACSGADTICPGRRIDCPLIMVLSFVVNNTNGIIIKLFVYIPIIVFAINEQIF